MGQELSWANQHSFHLTEAFSLSTETFPQLRAGPQPSTSGFQRGVDLQRSELELPLPPLADTPYSFSLPEIGPKKKPHLDEIILSRDQTLSSRPSKALTLLLRRTLPL